MTKRFAQGGGRRHPGRVLALWVLLATVLSAGRVAAEEVDMPGSRDHKMFRRIPGFFIERFDREEEGAFTFRIDGGIHTETGLAYWIDYRVQTGFDPPEAERIIGNHVAAVEALGGEVMARDGTSATFRIEEEATEIWVRLLAWGGNRYGLRIIESDAGPHRSSLDPVAIAENLRKTGRAAIYGLQFQDGEPALKPESAGILDAIAAVLKAYPDLKLFIVGHTDNAGDLLGNLNLSKRRANVVVRALLNTRGIEPGRLQPFGVGPLSPLASNADERGRALNRRLELVLQ